MKIKLSKSQWETVGKMAGWIKKAQTEMPISQTRPNANGTTHGTAIKGIKLIAKEGPFGRNELWLNDTTPLIYDYLNGDVDSILWPEFDREHLSGALYDQREMGNIPIDTKSVILPDGKVFNID